MTIFGTEGGEEEEVEGAEGAEEGAEEAEEVGGAGDEGGLGSFSDSVVSLLDVVTTALNVEEFPKKGASGSGAAIGNEILLVSFALRDLISKIIEIYGSY